MGVMVQRTGPSKCIYSGPMTDAEATGADFLQLRPEDAPSRGLTGWLADAIRAAIMDGRLGDEGLVSARAGTGRRVLGVPRLAGGVSRAARASGGGGSFRDAGFSGVLGVPGVGASAEGPVPAEGSVPGASAEGPVPAEG